MPFERLHSEKPSPMIFGFHMSRLEINLFSMFDKVNRKSLESHIFRFTGTIIRFTFLVLDQFVVSFRRHFDEQ